MTASKVSPAASYCILLYDMIRLGRIKSTKPRSNKEYEARVQQPSCTCTIFPLEGHSDPGKNDL